MGGEAKQAEGPDFGAGVALESLAMGQTIAGRVGDEAVLLSRFEDGLFAIGATCTHYGGPLGEGLAESGHVRCPWHHACFDLRTGEALKAPAFDPVARWAVAVEDGHVFVRGTMAAAPVWSGGGGGPEKVVIVGGGAAGFAAAEMLRRRGFGGSLTMISADADLPCDRPNLSKDYLAGQAPEEWLFLKDAAFYRHRNIDLRLKAEAAAIDPARRVMRLKDGGELPFDALLLATGSEPIRLGGFDHEAVHILRSVADARALSAAAGKAKSAVVVGASFIGLEVAASLRQRGLDVTVVAPDKVPMAPVLGEALGRHVQHIHEEKGVRFRLGCSAKGYDGQSVALDDGSGIAAELVVLGVGVRPRTALAEAAGLEVSNGVVVDSFLETKTPGIFAAGDIACHLDPASGKRARIEHWVVAEQQGQIAARNILGERVRYDEMPFFWSNHYDRSIHYVGHAGRGAEARIEGAIEDEDAIVRFYEGRRMTGAAAIGRPLDSLRAELALETAEG